MKNILSLIGSYCFDLLLVIAILFLNGICFVTSFIYKWYKQIIILMVLSVCLYCDFLMIKAF
jgi:hypothetical protein